MYNALRTLTVYTDLERELLKAPAPLSVTGCMESQKLMLAAELTKAFPGWTLYICADERSAAQAASDTGGLLGNGSVWQYPAKDLLFYSSDIHGSFIVHQRMDAIRHLLEDRKGFLIATVDALMDRIPSKETVRRERLRLYEGMVITTRNLSRILTGLGYEHAPQVETMGQYAVRGGIVDIYPMTMEEPFRVEFFDDEVDTIRSFDTATQRSTERRESIEIYPASDAVSSAVSGDDRGPSGEEVSVRGDSVSLLSYFEKDALVIMDDPVRIRERAEAVEAEFAESAQRRLESGIHPVSGDTGRSVVTDIFSAGRILEELKNRRCLLIAGLDESLKAFGAVRNFHFNTASVGSYKESFDRLISDIRAYQKQKYRVSVLTPSRTRASRLAENLREYEIHAFCPDEGTEEELQPGQTEVVCGNLRQGFIYPDIRYVLITESDMFGQKSAKRRKKKKYEGEKLISLTELS